MRIRDLAPVLMISIGGCLSQPRPCVDVCVEAHAIMEVCLDEWGLQWGEEIGYLDGDDYDNWCTTFIDEQLEMASARWGFGEGRRRAESTCGEQLTALETRSCDDYLASWDLWEPITQSSSE